MTELRTASEIAAAVNAEPRSARRVAESFVSVVERQNAKLNAILAFDKNHIDLQLKQLEKRLNGGGSLKLAGVPVIIKDNIITKDLPTTCGSRMLEGYQAPYEATVVERLRQAGAIIFAKANMDEFGMGSSCENSAFGPVKNPWNQARVAGGSSGGSAAAVAAGMAPLALGSDTGGSIRQPASFCGVVGFKPSYGRVSRYGLVAYGSSLDQIGAMARSVKDTALALEVLSGADSRDATSGPLPEIRLKKSKKSLSEMTFGVLQESFGEGLSKAVANAQEQAITCLKGQGAKIKMISIPTLPYMVATYYILATAEASANLARFDGIRFGHKGEGTLKEAYMSARERFGDEVKRRIMLGTFVLSSGYYDSFYGKAQKARRVITRDFEASLKEVDALLMPTTPVEAFAFGEKLSDPLSMYLTDIFTIGANLTGMPAVSLPIARDASEVPIGMQLMTARGSDEMLLGVAELCEAAFDWKYDDPVV